MNLDLAIALAQQGHSVLYAAPSAERERELLEELRQRFLTIDKDGRTAATLGNGRVTVLFPQAGGASTSGHYSVLVVEDTDVLSAKVLRELRLGVSEGDYGGGLLYGRRKH